MVRDSSTGCYVRMAKKSVVLWIGCCFNCCTLSCAFCSRSDRRSTFHICLEWSVILALAATCEWLRNPWFYGLAVVLIAARYHALSVLGPIGGVRSISVLNGP